MLPWAFDHCHSFIDLWPEPTARRQALTLYLTATASLNSYDPVSASNSVGILPPANLGPTTPYDRYDQFHQAILHLAAGVPLEDVIRIGRFEIDDRQFTKHMAVFCAKSLDYTDTDLSNIRAHIQRDNCTHSEYGEVCEQCSKEEFISMRANAGEGGDTDEKAIVTESLEGLDMNPDADDHPEVFSVSAEPKEAWWISVCGIFYAFIALASFLVTLLAKYLVLAVVICRVYEGILHPVLMGLNDRGESRSN